MQWNTPSSNAPKKGETAAISWLYTNPLAQKPLEVNWRTQLFNGKLQAQNKCIAIDQARQFHHENRHHHKLHQ